MSFLHRPYLFDYLFSKEAFLSIKTMLHSAKRGIEFTGETRIKAMNRLKTMLQLNPFEASISFLKLLQLLAISSEKRLIASICGTHRGIITNDYVACCYRTFVYIICVICCGITITT